MKLREMHDFVNAELESLEQAVFEIESIRSDFKNSTPNARELAATGLFLSNLYGGIENILKRIAQFHDIPLPVGPNWHIELIHLFSTDGQPELPTLIDFTLSAELAPYRRFRHVVHHGYAYQLKWHHTQPGVDGANSLFGAFRSRVNDYLNGVS